MSKESKLNLKLLVDAETKEDTKELLKKDLDIAESSINEYNYVPDFLIVRIEINESQLDDIFYQNVKECDSISILYDEASYKRGKKIIFEIRKVEILLQNLLVFVNELIEPYSGMLTDEGFEKVELTEEGRYEASVAEFSFGGLIKIMEMELSWKDYSPTASESCELLDSCDSFNDYKEALKKRNKSLKVWDLISENILEKQVEWSHIAGELKEIKKLRDRAAHLRVITQSQKKETLRNIKHVVDLISLQDIDKHELGDFIIQQEEIKKALANRLKQIKKTQEVLGSYSELTKRALEVPQFQLEAIKKATEEIEKVAKHNFKPSVSSKKELDEDGDEKKEENHSPGKD